MTLDANGPDGYPAEGGGHALQIASAHLQVQLASIAGFDGKLMFLTALNVAVVVALVGIAASADASLWLLRLGLVAASIGVLLGLGDLWVQDVQQFPTPAEAARVALDNSGDEDVLLWRYLSTINNISQVVDAVRRRKSRLTRLLLSSTVISLGLVVATALEAAI